MSACALSSRVLGSAVVSVAILVSGAASTQAGVPEGVNFGRWIVAPALRTSFETSDNIFFETESRAKQDQLTALSGKILGALPFKNSMLELEYAASNEIYQNTEIPRTLVQAARIELELDFKSGDELLFRDKYREDFARSEEVDPGGDLIFDGQPYNFNTWEIRLTRDDPRRQGYEVSVNRLDFVYEGDERLLFFDYRGFDNSFEYRQPLPSGRSLVVRYSPRRFNHYIPQSISGTVGIPFRKEATDSYELGLRGFLGRGQPYRFHLGYGSYRYTQSSFATSFTGIVGSGSWRLRLGGRTTLRIEAVRRPLPSNFETFYINNAVNVQMEREWRQFEGGAEIEFVSNNYAGTREDRRYEFEVGWRWRMHERFRFEVSAYHSRRESTVEFGDFNASGLETNLALGWF
jgi:hypothetical protein